LHKRAFERAQTQCHAAAQFVEERIGGGWGEKNGDATREKRRGE